MWLQFCRAIPSQAAHLLVPGELAEAVDRMGSMQCSEWYGGHG